MWRKWIDRSFVAFPGKLSLFCPESCSKNFIPSSCAMLTRRIHAQSSRIANCSAHLDREVVVLSAFFLDESEGSVCVCASIPNYCMWAFWCGIQRSLSLARASVHSMDLFRSSRFAIVTPHILLTYQRCQGVHERDKAKFAEAYSVKGQVDITTINNSSSLFISFNPRSACSAFEP